MDNAARLLSPDVAAAAAAIANAQAGRRGAPPVANVLDMLPEALFHEVVEDARAALEAASVAADATAPALRARGALKAADATALAMELGVSTIAILTRDAASRARAVLYATGVGLSASVLDHPEAHLLWHAIAGVLRDLPEDAPQP